MRVICANCHKFECEDCQYDTTGRTREELRRSFQFDALEFHEAQNSEVALKSFEQEERGDDHAEPQ